MPLCGKLSLDLLMKNSDKWNFRVLPSKFRLCSDMKNSEWIYVVAKGALTCSSEIPMANFPSRIQLYLERIFTEDFVKIGLCTILQ